MPVNPALWRLRQGEGEFEASLGYPARPRIKNKWFTIKNKLKAELPCDLAAPVLGAYPGDVKMKSGGRRDIYIPTPVVVLFSITKTWKQHE